MSQEVSPLDLEFQVNLALEALRARNDVYLIAVVGIPGSGKSTLCAALAQHLPAARVLPMDGYHVPRSELSPADMRRRGAPHTFDERQLRADLQALRRNHAGSFPAFDHAKKDPEPHAIHVTRDHAPILIEGNYLLLRSWGLEDLFDFKIFVACDIQLAMARVQSRLVDCRIVPSVEAAIQHVQTNDLLNAHLILQDNTRTRVDLIVSQG